MIEKMKMVYVVSSVSKKQEMLDGLRDLGVLHLAEKKTADRKVSDKFRTLSKTASTLAEYAPDKKEKSAKKSGYRTKQQKSADAKRKLRIKELESLIAQSEEEILSLEAKLSDPEVMADYVQMNEICTAIEEKKAMHSEYEDEWLMLIEEE